MYHSVLQVRTSFGPLFCFFLTFGSVRSSRLNTTPNVRTQRYKHLVLHHATTRFSRFFLDINAQKAFLGLYEAFFERDYPPVRTLWQSTGTSPGTPTPEPTAMATASDLPITGNRRPLNGSLSKPWRTSSVNCRRRRFVTITTTPQRPYARTPMTTHPFTPTHNKPRLTRLTTPSHAYAKPRADTLDTRRRRVNPELFKASWPRYDACSAVRYKANSG